MEELYYPIKVKLKLKKTCYQSLNQWLCHISDEPRIVTTEIVEYVASDIEEAAQSFRKTEVEYVIISAHYPDKKL